MSQTSHLKRIEILSLFISTFFLLSNNRLEGQSTREVSQELSKPAQKGMLINTAILNGNIVVTYAMKVDKKNDQLNYEDYVFDKDLNFKGIQPGKENKESRPDKKVTALSAYAGGTNSFNINSQKLNVDRIEAMMTWNYQKQRYELSQRLSSDKVKLKNDEGRYDGYTSLTTEEGVFIIASYDPGGKDVKDQFVALYVDNDLNVKQTPVTTGGNYSLVFYGERESGNPFVIMAPKNKMPDTKQYVYAEFTTRADLVKRISFNSPSPNMLVMDFREINNDLYFVGTSTKSNDPYEEEFTDYADMENPGQGISRQAQKYSEDVFKKDMANFHLLKLKGGELVFASSTPVKNFDDKVITPPGQKKSHAYDGKRLEIEALSITPTGEYLVAGQLMDKNYNLKRKVWLTKYKDNVALFFSSNGELKAQYAVEKVNDDTKSEVFRNTQSFALSSDGKSAYWQIMEVKSSKGYATLLDAWNGNTSFTPHYFPRIAKIDLTTNSLSGFTVMGDNGKFLMYQTNSILADGPSKTVYYIGHDGDYEKLWLGKVELK